MHFPDPNHSIHNAQFPAVFSFLQLKQQVPRYGYRKIWNLLTRIVPDTYSWKQQECGTHGAVSSPSLTHGNDKNVELMEQYRPQHLLMETTRTKEHK